MQAISRTPTKFSGSLTIYVDTDRGEVVIRDAHGQTHRFTPGQAADLRRGLLRACLALDTVSL